MIRKFLISALCMMFAFSGVSVVHAEEPTDDSVEEVTPVEEESKEEVTEEETETTPEETPEEDISAEEPEASHTPGVASGTQKAFVIGDDWGAAVSKTIMELDVEIDPESVSAEKFNVAETKPVPDFSNYPDIVVNVETSDRTIIDAYTSDATGNEVTTASHYVTVEMYVSPDEGSAFYYTGLNNWCDPYELAVTLVDEATLTTTGSETIATLDVAESIDLAGEGKICPQIDGVVFYGVYGDTDTSYYYTAEDGTVVQVPYAYYEPAEDGHKNAIVVWNHGAGEGGTDPQIDVLANEVTALFGEEFQSIMDGAYVITPQVPKGSPRDANRANAIASLVRELAAENPDIDLDRVYVGGCSAGGGMTMTSLFTTPELYAAAFPICPASFSERVTDEQIEAIVDIPIWFIHALNDTTVKPERTTEPLVERLTAAGAEVHTSLFDDVHDTTGRFTDENGDPYQYAGHWSWIYFDNNECFDEEGTNCWEWLSEQVKVHNVRGTQKAYVIGDDWGPAVTKTIINLKKTISAESISADKFEVIETKLMTNFGQNPDIAFGEAYVGSTPRTITAAYPSDDRGNPVDGDSHYITIEMYVSPNEGSPFIYSLATGFNSWCDPYELHISLKDGATLVAPYEEIDTLNIEASIDVAGDGKICPQGEVFAIGEYTAKDGVTYSYAEYIPDEDDQKNALVIWLHGAGEGGHDPQIDYLGNEVTAFVGEEFQSLFEGAYVLCPQAPTMWMDDGTGAYQNGETGSCYAEGLFDLIDTYVKNHPDIDPDRVIIGGCSNGGYMTMEMILKHPNYFAAAFPICEAYEDQYITDEEIEAIKDMAIWFTYARTDGVVDYTICTEATVARLRAAGAKNIHVSVFDNVIDTTGRFTDENGDPYEYNGHWSWIYFDNDECYDGSIRAWAWLAEQKRVDKPTNTTTGDEAYIMPFAMMTMLSLAGFVALSYKKKHDIAE